MDALAVLGNCFPHAITKLISCPSISTNDSAQNLWFAELASSEAVGRATLIFQPRVLRL